MQKGDIFVGQKLTDEQGRVLADGTNLDDMSDYRPGHQPLQELKVASPLKEAGLTKQEIQRLYISWPKVIR